MRRFLSLFTVLMLYGVFAFAQTRVVTGKVLDAKGDPVPGASVKVKGGTAGAAADENGNFKISAKTGDQLVVTALNFSSVTSKLGDQTLVNFTLTQQENKLQEVVVTALGITRQAKDLGYAVSSVTNKTLTQAKSVNVAQALNGKVSGLNISTVNSGVFENAKI